MNIRLHLAAEEEFSLMLKRNAECVHNALSIRSLMQENIVSRLYQCNTKSAEVDCYLCGVCGLHTHIPRDQPGELVKSVTKNLTSQQSKTGVSNAING